jgi:AcrR family transcriptional regulator
VKANKPVANGEKMAATTEDAMLLPPSGQERGEQGQIGRRLREARHAAGLTIRQTAQALNVSPATWSAIENNRTRVGGQRLAAASDLFGLTIGGDASASAPRCPDWRVYPPLVLPPPLAGALKAFVEFGYHGATIRTIAERAGLSVPGLYHHHPNKQDLLAALHELTMTDLLWRARAAREEGRDPVERFSRLIECLALYHTHRQELSFIGASEMRGLYPENRARIVRFRDEMQQMVDEEVIEGCRLGLMKTALPKEAARAVAIMCTGIARWWSAKGPSTPEQVAEHYVGFALEVVGAH